MGTSLFWNGLAWYYELTAYRNYFSLLQEEEAHFMRLVSVLHDLLICDTTNKEKRDELQKYVLFALCLCVFFIFGSQL